MSGGRPSKLTDERMDAICESLAQGATRAAAAEAAGISRTTLYEWEKAFPDIAHRIKEAEAELVNTCVSLILAEAKKGTWTAAAWLLERRHPKDFGRKAILSGDSEGPPVVFRLDLSDKPEGSTDE